MSPATRSRIARVHRWLAIALSPVIALILLSGIVLAFRPLLRRDAPRADAAALDVPRVVTLLDSLDPRGEARAVFFDQSRRTMGVVARSGEPAFHDIASGRVVPAPVEARHDPDAFDVAERIHRELWFGAEWLVTLASLAMIVLVVVGPLLSRPRPGRSALSWHTRAGWLLWPLVAVAPLSLVMTKLHPPIVHRGAAPPIAPARAIEQAARVTDLSHLLGVQPLPGTVLLATTTPTGPQRLILDNGRLRPFDSGVSRLGRALHEGTWAGPWSAVLSAFAAMVTLGMLATGMTSWLRRRAASTRATARRAAARAA